MLVNLSIGANKILDIRQYRGVVNFSLYDATRGLTTSTLITLKLLGMSVWFVISWAIIFVSFWVNAALLSEFYGLTSFWQFLVEPFNNYAWYLIAVKILVWCVQLATLVVAFGVLQTFVVLNTKTMSLIGIVGFGLIVYTMAILNYSLSTDLPVLLMHALVGLLILLGGVGYLFVVSFRDRVLSVVKSLGITGLWLVYAIAYAFVLANQEAFIKDATYAIFVVKAIVSLIPLLAILAAFRVFFLFRHQ